MSGWPRDLEAYFGQVWLVRLIFQRAFATIYLIAFLAALEQGKPLLGERGLLPIPAFLKRARFREAPSIFFWRYADGLLEVVAWTGVVLSAAAAAGFSERGPLWLSASVWLLLYVLYLSIVNVGQTFYGFGWESMLLEAGFFASFLGATASQPSLIPVLILRWMLFRTELGAGLIKLRHDRCWRELTCLFYHYETQPLPNPLSWYFHQLPKAVHRSAVLFSHFVQVVVPFALFAPQPLASIAGGLTIFHQLWLIVSGNYSWLNWLTAALGLAAFDDKVLAHALPLGVPQLAARPESFQVVLYALAVAAVLLSIPPTLNLFSKNQLMNYSYNPLHLVNTYGAFGSVTKKRYEIVIEGTDEPFLTKQTRWQEYEFKAKPGGVCRRPPQIAPYHLRLDWLMWFLPFSVAVYDGAVEVPAYESWFLRLIEKLVENDNPTVMLLGRNPFEKDGPRFVRALFYDYRYTTWREKKETGAWWVRRLVGTYLPPVGLSGFRQS